MDGRRDSTGSRIDVVAGVNGEGLEAHAWFLARFEGGSVVADKGRMSWIEGQWSGKATQWVAQRGSRCLRK
jgi:hypothetical protein